MGKFHEIELRSDTMTKPTPEMRVAMSDAIVGDDGHGEDPTVHELEELAARIMGMEAARFFPSGIMANLSAVMSHCWERGQEVILGDRSHIHVFEEGGIAQLAGVHHRAVANYDDGTLDLAAVQKLMYPMYDHHKPTSSLLCIENTHNRCSGAVLPVKFLDEVACVAKNNNLSLHLDGARIFNAAAALDVPVTSLVRNCDSVSFCLSKGLACPIGSILTGSREFIDKATRSRRILGGSMRQSGIVAAAGIIGLNTMIHRLSEDHTNARIIGQAIESCNSEVCSLYSRVQSNMILVKLHESISPEQFCSRMNQVTDVEAETLQEDELCVVRMMTFLGMVRMVTHNDVSSKDTSLVVKKLKYVIDEFEKKPPFNVPLR